RMDIKDSTVDTFQDASKTISSIDKALNELIKYRVNTGNDYNKVFIKLTMEGGIMKANIGASTKDAYNLLNSNMQLIEDKLQNSGIKVQELSLNIYNEDTTFFKQSSENGKNSNPSKSENKADLSSMDEIPEEENISAIDGNVNILA
ncbi:flagellar hook-length control protein FliK, partial [Clostridium botulinum]